MELVQVKITPGNLGSPGSPPSLEGSLSNCVHCNRKFFSVHFIKHLSILLLYTGSWRSSVTWLYLQNNWGVDVKDPNKKVSAQPYRRMKSHRKSIKIFCNKADVNLGKLFCAKTLRRYMGRYLWDIAKKIDATSIHRLFVQVPKFLLRTAAEREGPSLEPRGDQILKLFSNS